MLLLEGAARARSLSDVKKKESKRKHNDRERMFFANVAAISSNIASKSSTVRDVVRGFSNEGLNEGLNCFAEFFLEF